RMRHAIACIIVALKSRSDEDMTISAKVCAKIAADQFEDEIMSAIVSAGKKAAEKAGRHVAMKLRKGKAGADDGPGETADEGSGTTKPAPKPAADVTKPDSPDVPTSTGSTSTPTPKTQSPPAADNLGITPHGQTDHKAPVPAAKHEGDVPNVQAARAVADMKKKIQEDMLRQAQQAVGQSSCKNDAGAQAGGDTQKKPSKRRGTADNTATPAAAATGDKAKEATGATDTVSGNQQFVRLVFGPDLADWSRDRAAERDAK